MNQIFYWFTVEGSVRSDYNVWAWISWVVICWFRPCDTAESSQNSKSTLSCLMSRMTDQPEIDASGFRRLLQL